MLMAKETTLSHLGLGQSQPDRNLLAVGVDTGWPART